MQTMKVNHKMTWDLSKIAFTEAIDLGRFWDTGNLGHQSDQHCLLLTARPSHCSVAGLLFPVSPLYLQPTAGAILSWKRAPPHPTFCLLETELVYY